MGLEGPSGGRFGPSAGSFLGDDALMVAVCTTHLSSVVGNFDLDGAEFALLRGATPFDTEVNMSRRTDRGYVEGADSVGWFRGGGDEVVGGGRW